ncbi:hypothetical protein [Zoogloea sp.]|uniref:hypothetical protein n=1 Tax=Zoogloea sp. TaxID=49181 RepID=UPI00260D0C7D|nr:hypothetical protein [Zoogloea sp.]MDD3353334.1 hypothetical protein [Zoogloea sp.]
MKTPKLLPWHARKAGVSIERAEALWRKALREATADTGWVGNSEFWGAAEARFLELLQEEQNTLCDPQMETFIRTQNRMGLLPLLAAEEMFTALSANWQRFCKQLNKAA